MATYNQIVRDKKIASLQYMDRAFTYSTLNDEEFDRELKNKLRIKVDEFIATNGTEHLATIIELAVYLAKTQGQTEAELMQERMNQLELKGGYELRYFLQEISEEDQAEVE